MHQKKKCLSSMQSEKENGKKGDKTSDFHAPWTRSDVYSIVTIVSKNRVINTFASQCLVFEEKINNFSLKMHQI